jgi:hypothetical protein
MRKLLLAAAVSLAAGFAAPAVPAQPQPEQRPPLARERAEHPRIAAAIRELEEAIRYMEKAPHDFGGHKASAIGASRQAVTELRQALAYRASKDENRPKRP